MQEIDTRFVVQQEIIAAGLAALDPEAKDYLIGGAETEATIVRNRAAIERRSLRPRVLVDVSGLSTQTRILKRVAQLPGPRRRFAPLQPRGRFGGWCGSRQDAIANVFWLHVPTSAGRDACINDA